MADAELEYSSVWLERGVDVTVAHPARRYDYWLGGKDNFPADRASGDAVAAAFPTIRTAVVENRRFLGRAVSYLAGEAGIDQFLDIGTGIPAADNTHEVAQRINPAARVVYVDNDPIVLAHARALLTSAHADGATAYIDADLREPETILADSALARTLDLSRPVALMLVAVLHFVFDEDGAYDLVHRLVSALPAGSLLVMSHATNDFMPPELLADVEAVTRSQGGYRPRTREEFARFFDGYDLLPPGLVPVVDWRADGEPEPRPTAQDAGMYAAIARIPA
jgi:hypothetical protein